MGNQPTSQRCQNMTSFSFFFSHSKTFNFPHHHIYPLYFFCIIGITSFEILHRTFSDYLPSQTKIHMKAYQSLGNISFSLYSDKIYVLLSPFTQSKTPKKIENVFIFLVPSSEPCEKLLPIHPAEPPESDTSPKLITLPRPSRAGTRHDICQMFYTSTVSKILKFSPEKRVNRDISDS